MSCFFPSRSSKVNCPTGNFLWYWVYSFKYIFFLTTNFDGLTLNIPIIQEYNPLNIRVPFPPIPWKEEAQMASVTTIVSHCSDGGLSHWRSKIRMKRRHRYQIKWNWHLKKWLDFPSRKIQEKHVNSLQTYEDFTGFRYKVSIQLLILCMY